MPQEATPAFEVTDPDFAARVRANFDRQGLMGGLGAVLTNVEPGFVAIELPYAETLTQQHGFFHAGAVSSIADTAGGFAASTLFGAEDGILTVEFKINLMAPADGDLLVAEGRVVKPGRTLTLTTADVFVRKNGALKQCALMQQTLMRIVGRSGIVG